MLIQLHTDKNLTIHAEYQSKIEEQINTSLSRFSSHVGRVEVHFSDENGNKSGQDDKRCLLEVKVEGRAPIAVTNTGENYDLALAGALTKASNALQTVIGKLQEKHTS